MTRIFWSLLFASTAAGLALPFLPVGAWPWWDSTWILLFFAAVYADLVSWSGLSSARMSSGIVVVSLGVLLGLSALTGWPIGPLRFTEHSGMQLGGAIPLVIPLLGFSLLTVSGEAASAAFPGAGRLGLAAGTAAAFLLVVANGIRFFTLDRVWWLWNPSGTADVGARAALAFGVLLAAGFSLAFAYPVDSRLRLSRWNFGVLAWVLTNLLFLTSRLSAWVS